MNLCVFQKERYRYEWKKSGPLELIMQFARDLKHCRQRITKGYCDPGVWEMFAWKLTVIPNALETLKENHLGHPAEFANVEDGDKQWEQVLAEMIRLFREADEDFCSKKNPYEDKWIKELEIHDFKRTLSDLDRKHLEAEKELFIYRNESKDEAFVLFSKWFFSLWD